MNRSGVVVIALLVSAATGSVGCRQVAGYDYDESFGSEDPWSGEPMRRRTEDTSKDGSAGASSQVSSEEDPSKDDGQMSDESEKKANGDASVDRGWPDAQADGPMSDAHTTPETRDAQGAGLHDAQSAEKGRDAQRMPRSAGSQ